MPPHLHIVGAGIGGLSLAIAAQQKQLTSSVYEQSESIKAVGAGILLANNAMQVYKKLGLHDLLVEEGHALSAMHVTTAELKPLSKTKLFPFEKKYGVKTVAIHRGKLQQLLVDALPGDTIFTQHRLNHIATGSEKVELHFDKQATVKAKCVVGADGIDSVVRKQIVSQSRIRTTNQLCWRGLCKMELDRTYQHTAWEAWGKGSRFGFTQIDHETVYWYALKSLKPDESTPKNSDLVDLFSAYHPIVVQLIKTTPTNSLHVATMADLQPIKNWYTNNIVLLGDAAHATTPNLGQGACQAIEDAYALANCLAKHNNQEKAFAAYQRLRLSKANSIVRTSRLLGEVAHFSNPLATTLRNSLMRITPNFIQQQQLARTFKPSFSN